MQNDHILALLKKEIGQVKKDKSILLIVFILPIILILIYGFGLSMDVKPVSVCIYDMDNSEFSKSLKKNFAGSDFFDVYYARSLEQNNKIFYDNKVIATIIIPKDCQRDIGINKANVLVSLDGSESFNAFISLFYIKNTIQKSLNDYLMQKGINQKSFSINYRNWFNEENISPIFLLPGQIVGIVTLIACFMCAIVIAREFDRDTFDGLKATNITELEFLLSKFIPYYILSILGAIVAFFVTFMLFDMPYRGSYVWGIAIMLVYIFTSVSLGLFVSILTKNQFLSCVLSVIISFLPSILLSGVIFDLRAVSYFIQIIGYALPPTYAVDAMRICFLSGGSNLDLIYDFLFILIFGMVIFMLTLHLLKRAFRC